MEFSEYGKNMVRAPLNMGAATLSYGKQIVGGAVEVFLPRRDGNELSDHLSEGKFDHDLGIAMNAYKTGRKRRDHELGFVGGGLLVRLLCKADKRDDVPEAKVIELATYVRKEGLDPILEPLVSDDDAEHATELLEKHAPDTEVFFDKRK